MKKDEVKGITLIALVITIIILLILAGVTIAMLTGENGILNKATTAQEKTNRETAEEKVKLEVEGSLNDKGKLNKDQLRTNLKNNLGLNESDIIDNEDGTMSIFIDGYEIIVDSNGRVSPEDISGANQPELKEEMQAITYAKDGSPKIVLDPTKKDWYSYEETTDENMEDGGTTDGGNSRWANAYVKNDKGEITQYYVWIPRYAYKIDKSVKYSSQSGTSNKIDVQFIGTDITNSNVATEVGEGWIVHPAFTFGEKELSGIWVGKYETTGTADEPTILPNKTSLRNISLSEMFYTSQSLSTEKYDAHMMKNTEWGAVAYLAQSKYGRNGTEISVNQCESYYTGVGKGTGENKIYDSTYNWSEVKDEQKYNGKIGKMSSTTGNIYGIYDMAGGAYEYVMAVYGTEENPTPGGSGFTKFPDKKYYDLYTKTTMDETNIGDALYETKGWNSDGAVMVTSAKPFFGRGGYYVSTHSSGLYRANYYGGGGGKYYSFRVVVAMN